MAAKKNNTLTDEQRRERKAEYNRRYRATIKTDHNMKKYVAETIEEGIPF